MEIRYYITASGAAPVAKYLEDLARPERAAVDAALRHIAGVDRLEDALVNCRPISGKLWELKVGQQRVFYVLILGPTMVLLNAYKKQSQKAPRGEIEVAKKRMREVLGE